MRARLALIAMLAVGSAGVVAGPASADPAGRLCGSVNITVNGQALVDQSQCQVLPPQ